MVFLLVGIAGFIPGITTAYDTMQFAGHESEAMLLGLFQVVPIVIGANASFRDWALYNPKKTWIGLDHYRAVITDPAFYALAIPAAMTFVFM